MFKQITVIGCGLIGSSILRRLKKIKQLKKLVSYDKNKNVTDIIKKENISDIVAPSLN